MVLKKKQSKKSISKKAVKKKQSKKSISKKAVKKKTNQKQNNKKIQKFKLKHKGETKFKVKNQEKLAEAERKPRQQVGVETTAFGINNQNKNSNKFYITTAIDYPNAEPHIGHAYQKVIADVLARWNKLLGKDVWFLTGTDEHGKKIQESAEKANKSPKEFVDELSLKFKEAWTQLNIQPNRFIRTTDPDHKKLVQDVIKKCYTNGDIYLGKYEGYYCIGCEAYYTKKDLVEGKCPLHNRPLEKLKEESYFFRLSKYQNFLLDYYEKNQEFILPKERRNEMINRIKEGLKDLSISRTSFNWGIPFPLNPKHITYVWFDALFNYISGAGKNHEYWPADLHLLGKDNGWFHAVYWPAFLKSAGYALPKTVYIHGFLTFNGQKISKSLGNSISPKILVEKYGANAVRYFLCRGFVFGEDGDFSETALIERNNNELANKLGNLVLRATTLAEANKIEKIQNNLIKKLKLDEIKSLINNYEFDKALQLIFQFIDDCNFYVQQNELWKSKDKKKLYEVIDSIKAIAILLYPFIPATCEKIAHSLNFKIISIDEIQKPIVVSKIKKSEILFKKIDLAQLQILPERQREPHSEEGRIITKVEKKWGNKMKNPTENKNLDVEQKHSENKSVQKQAQPKQESKFQTNLIDFAEFQKLDIRIGTIIEVKSHPNADKLYILKVSFGAEERQIVAGLKNFYTEDELLGKQITVIINLRPIVLRGVESQGMLLAAQDDEGKVVIIAPEKKLIDDARVS